VSAEANVVESPEGLSYGPDGLLPVVVQDATSKEVLMLAYADSEAVRRTVETKTTWFWSRSRGEYWNKGATSGNTQSVVEIRYDCDADALLVLVDAAGPACHTGERTCFFRSFDNR
jgi:phosphoribosyl-AMP cyclohydrolase